jgi:hypothetical protein
MNMKKSPYSSVYPLTTAIVASCIGFGGVASSADELKPGVRGVVTRAPAGMKIDGDLSEFKDAFCTPVEYHNAELNERAAQFFYMWDETAFYAGLRTLDTKPFNGASDDRLWEGDAVEWYFGRATAFAARHGQRSQMPVPSIATGLVSQTEKSKAASASDRDFWKPSRRQAWKPAHAALSMEWRSSSNCHG